MSHTNKNWLIAILICVIIFFTTSCCMEKITDISTVVNSVSLFSSLLSILLSVFAIFYSYHSIVQADRQGEEVAKTLQEIKDSHEMIKDNNTQLVQIMTMVYGKLSIIECHQGKADEKSSFSEEEKQMGKETPNNKNKQ